MGFFTRLFVPPKPVKKLQRSLHPASNLEYSVQRSIATSLRSGGKRRAKVYTHGNCPVRHRTPEAAARWAGRETQRIAANNERVEQFGRSLTAGEAGCSR
jgi:hypothetical protein